MTDLLRLFTLLTDRKMHQETPGIFARFGLCACVYLFVFMALLSALVALWISMLPIVGPALAPLVVSGVLLVLALLFYGLLRRRRVATTAPSALRAGETAVEVEGIFREHKGALLLALFTAAFQSGVTRR